jgi:hypothetical protein
MFHRDGRWKEFGVNGVDTTYIPFWFVCIVWAIVSDAILLFLVSDEGGHAANAVAVSAQNIVAPEPGALEPLPVSTPPPNTPEGQPGYYKLDEAVMKQKGTPLYIYIGPEKPSDVN